MGFHTQRNGFVTVSAIIGSIIEDLTANGFTLKFPAALQSPYPALFKATLEATASVDSLALTQKWRIHFDVLSEYGCKMYVASDLQLPDDGTTSKLERGLSLTAADSAGVLGSDLAYPYKLDATTLMIPQNEINQTTEYDIASVARLKRINNADKQFIDRTVRIPDMQTAQSYPMSYILSISDRGFSLVIWEEAQDPTGDKFSWVSVQRPVDRTTGVALVSVDSKTPLFCVYGLKDMYVPAAIFPDNIQSTQSNEKQIIYLERWESGIKRFVVRERDVLKPTPSTPGTYDTADSNSIINAAQQVSITEDNKYVITFPNKLNTPRHAYVHELDMIAYTSADVVSQHTEVPLTVYGEPTARIYQAMPANGANNTNMRLLVLKSGGGV